eukprot:2443711-Pyramimonas_sp.AAC.1
MSGKKSRYRSVTNRRSLKTPATCSAGRMVVKSAARAHHCTMQKENVDSISNGGAIAQAS